MKTTYSTFCCSFREIICTKSQTITRKYVHLRQSAFNCAKCTLYKDICIIVNIQLSFKTFINVLRHSNSSKQLSFARIVNSITLKCYYDHVLSSAILSDHLRSFAILRSYGNQSSAICNRNVSHNIFNSDR